MRNPCTTSREEPPISTTTEKPLQQQRPRSAKNKLKKKLLSKRIGPLLPRFISLLCALRSASDLFRVQRNKATESRPHALLPSGTPASSPLQNHLLNHLPTLLGQPLDKEQGRIFQRCLPTHTLSIITQIKIPGEMCMKMA